MPLADAARRLDVSCGKRPAALPPAHGASPRLSGQTLAGPQMGRWRIRSPTERGSVGSSHVSAHEVTDARSAPGTFWQRATIKLRYLDAVTLSDKIACARSLLLR